MRVLLAGVLAGLVMFFTGAFAHTVMQWEGRVFKQIPDESGFREWIRRNQLTHGIYGFPGGGAHDIAEEEWETLTQLYKEGPNGVLFIGRTGEEMMSGRELGLEFASNVVVATLAAFVVLRLRPGATFGLRWLVVVFIGMSAWFSVSASHAIWYRFYWPFVRDELYCVSLESVLAGLVIAALVKPALAHPALENV